MEEVLGQKWVASFLPEDLRKLLGVSSLSENLKDKEATGSVLRAPGLHDSNIHIHTDPKNYQHHFEVDLWYVIQYLYMQNIYHVCSLLGIL